jgi:uncharacterized protein YacL
MYVSINFFSILLILLTIILNTCLAVDLILMIKHPFARKETRETKFLVGSFLLSFTLTWTIMLTTNNQHGYLIPPRSVRALVMLVFATYFALSIASVVYAAKKLCRSSISKETIKLVLLRHVLYIIGFMIANIYLFASVIWMFTPN